MSGPGGRWIVSGNAARRYARIVYGWDDGGLLPIDLFKAVVTDIIRESLGAHFVRQYPPRNEHPPGDLWRGPKPRRLRYVVAQKPAPGARLPVLITVLPTVDTRMHRGSC